MIRSKNFTFSYYINCINVYSFFKIFSDSDRKYFEVHLTDSSLCMVATYKNNNSVIPYRTFVHILFVLRLYFKI
jgi:hypothetical protein